MKTVKKQIKLSKSKMKSNENCILMMWNDINAPKEKVWDSMTEFTFEQGRVVEMVARNMYPEAVLQDERDNYTKTIKTRELFQTHNVVFEAAFAKRSVVVQFDILSKNAAGNFDAVEIKSASKLKPDYMTDVIIQYWIATLSGIKIDRFELWVVNTKSTGITDEYFTKHDMTEHVQSSERRFWEMLSKAHKTLKMKTAPNVKIGSHCDKFECPYRGTEKCALVVNQDSVHALPRFSAAWAAHDSGITSVNHAAFVKKEEEKISPLQKSINNYIDAHPLVLQSVRKNKMIIDQEGLKKDLAQWTFPLNFFDFESLMSAIPVLQGQRPYEQVVFQFSNHIYNGVDKKMKHSMFLHETKNDPNLPAIEAMINLFSSNDGSIVAWFKPFEVSRIKSLAEKFPSHSAQLLALVPRIVDLMDLVKANAYSPEFMGSYSLKVVSPVLLKEYGSYTDSVIKSGSEIAKYYIEMITTEDMERKELIKTALIKYCSYDTLNLYLVLMYLLDQSVDLKELVELNLESAE
jgi:hypothetical protein